MILTLLIIILFIVGVILLARDDYRGAPLAVVSFVALNVITTSF